MPNSIATTLPAVRDFVVGNIMHPVFRIGAGLLFMQHGAQKLFGALGGTPVDMLSRFGLAGVLEFFGGLLIVIGLLTRPIAVALTLLMAAAFITAHVPRGGFPIQNGGELALLYALVFAFLASIGPGKWSLDERVLPRLA